MLEASRNEIRKAVPDDVRGLKRAWKKAYLFLDVWIYEPICTGLRFLHLVFIFVPVIASVPVIWFGKRVEGRDGERTGTLWWYGFLVSSMERAGPAFIKVGFQSQIYYINWIKMLRIELIAMSMGSLSVRHLPHRNVC
jgi:aarF domain-containing kinase